MADSAEYVPELCPECGRELGERNGIDWCDNCGWHAEQSADYACPNCGEDGLSSMAEGTVCRLCGEEAREPFREGWDESD